MSTLLPQTGDAGAEARKPNSSAESGEAGACAAELHLPSADSSAAGHSAGQRDLWGAFGDALQAQRRAPPLEAMARDQPLPLSFAQQRIWLIQQAALESPAYNLPFAWRFSGPLDGDALEKSLNALVQQHEILRTRFADDGAHPAQIVESTLTLKLSVHDLQRQRDEERERELLPMMRAEAARPFDLTRLPLCRAILYRLAPEEHVFLLVLHHIVFDGWSLGVFVRELQAAYCSLSRGEPLVLTKPKIQYADFAIWQRRWLQGDVLESQLAYWKGQLGGRLPALELPSDYPPPSKRSWRGETYRFSVPGSLLAKVESLRKQEQATLYVVWLAAVNAWLHRYTGQEDLVVGSPTANRTRNELGNVIGFFVNTQVLRTQVRGRDSFREIVRAAKAVSLAAYARQDLPFDRLVEELRPARQAGHTPLFQVMFSFQHMPHGLELPGAKVRALELDNGTAKFDLLVELRDNQEGVEAFFEYSTDLFTAATIQRMAGHFLALLAGAVANPDQSVASLSVLTEQERRQVLVEWNDTRRAYPRDRCVHELFEAQAVRTPASIALTFQGQTLSYAQLNTRANRLAHHLRALGAGPDTLVAVALERDLDLIVALLGILKAGAAYVPLETTYPKERLALMLADTRPLILITREAIEPGLPLHESKLVLLPKSWERISRCPGDNPVNLVSPDHLAYVMFTSGSTGRPKGVMVPHRGIVRLVQGANYARLGAEEVFLQFAPVSFDASTFEIWGCLLNGGRLAVFPPDTPSLDDLGAAVLKQQVTTLWLTTALLHKIAETDLASLRHVRQLLTGGDVLSVSCARQVLEGLPRCAFMNCYGPTECTTFATFYPLSPEAGLGTSVPVGRPITNTEVYLLDSALQPVAVGMPGELFLGGDGLARGYLNRPELTAERFVPHPFSNEPGARLYRTGDLARYRSDGDLEFLGRSDRQVKVRGFRVEPGEVEAVLAQHTAVREPVVVLKPDANGEKRLVAYFTCRDAERVAPEELRKYLQERLPDYMLPSPLVQLATLPLTPSGKVDRHALEALEASPPAKPDAPVAGPRSLVEEVVAGIWAEVLGLDRVGIHDDFFLQGGNSLLAIDLMSKLRKAFHADLPVRLLFEWPTVAGLAERIHDVCQPQVRLNWSGSAAGRSLTPIQPLGSRQPFYLIPGGVGSDDEFLVYARMARHLGMDQPFYGMKARGTNGREKGHTDVVTMAADYLREIRQVQPEGPYLLVGECIGGIVAYEMAQQLLIPGQSVGLLAMLDTWAPPTGEFRLYRRKMMWQNAREFLPIYLLLRAGIHLRTLGRLRPGDWRSFLKSKARNARIRVAMELGPRTAARQADGTPVQLPPKRDWHYFRTVTRYEPRPYPGAVALLVSEEQHARNPTLGWQEWVAGGLQVYPLTGNHHSYIREYVAGAASRLKELLNRAAPVVR